MFDIITIGSATVDAFAQIDKRCKKQDHYEFKLGDKVLIHNIDFHTGGGGTNTAVAFSRLGLKTAFVGKLGMGHNSQRVLNMLHSQKVNTSLVSRECARTGFSVIMEAKGYDRSILAFKGSNSDLRWKDVDQKKLKTRWFYFCSMVDKSFSTLENAALFAKKNNIRIAFNPSSYLASKGYKFMKKVLDNCDILILNKEEAELLTKKKGIDKLLAALKKYAKIAAVMTDGKNGAYAFDGGKKYFIKGSTKKIADTTGAGDSFGSTFVAGMVMTDDIEFSLKLAQANAESCISKLGAKPGLLYKKQALQMMKRYTVR